MAVQVTGAGKFSSQSPFQSIEDSADRFFALFPHRFDYIYAQHPEPAKSPDWLTESRHPLSSRIFDQGSYLFGVRFGSQTQYCVLDIDKGSFYHPQRDSLAIGRILAALEPIGITTHVACTSSYSGGLHLYFPFSEAQSSWELATAVTAQLENAGFHFKPGQLEVFPNPKPYAIEGNLNLFNAHRLPMQAGSYLLSDDFQPIYSDRRRFVEQWQCAQTHNCVDRKTIKRILKQVKRTHHISGKADKFISDLNAEIELGWTGQGQTNRLLGRIAMRAYIFSHVISGGVPLEGQSLVDEIVSTAQSLPGYQDWCNHQHEIEQRAEEWARCIQTSRYFHYGSVKGKYKRKEPNQVNQANQAIAEAPSWNQQQSAGARERIRAAIADLLNQGQLPAAATARFHAITAYGIGGGSLYRHRDLWHPGHLEAVENLSVKNASACSNTSESFDCVEDASNVQSLTSLLPAAGGNVSPDAGCSDRQPLIPQSTGGNCSSLNRQQLLASGDPILVAEALSWSRSPIPAPVLLSIAPLAIDCLATAQAAQPDFSDALAEISAQVRRLGWSKAQTQEALYDQFGKRDRAMLLDEEILQWLLELRQRNPGTTLGLSTQGGN